jgi:RNA polymerase sigma-70 factor (ECF subfamily)
MIAADEQQLILQVKEGSHEAYRVLVERYMRHAYNIAFGYVTDHDDAEDIAQESFMRIYESIRSFRGEASFNSWLYRIVTNLSLNRLRQRKNGTYKMVDPQSQLMLNTVAAPTDSHSQDVRPILECALHDLSTLQRAVVILRHLNGLSTKQVSVILKCSEGTIKTHLHRGLKKMKTQLGAIKDDVL